MSGAKLPVPAIFRDALRDSSLDRTAKAVGFVISTYMDGRGVAFPSKATIAKGASLGDGRRSVDKAVNWIEEAGLLEVAHSRGRTANTYRVPGALLTAHAVRRSTAHDSSPTAHETTPTAHRGAPESAQGAESNKSIKRNQGRAMEARLDLSYLDRVDDV